MDHVARYLVEHPEAGELPAAVARAGWSREELGYLLELVRLGEKPPPEAIAAFLRQRAELAEALDAYEPDPVAASSTITVDIPPEVAAECMPPIKIAVPAPKR